MMLTFVCAGLVGILPTGDTPPPLDPKPAYEQAKAQAGRSSEEQVKLALWCESHGLTVQRLHHLTLAILADPKNAMARGLMGLVAHDGRWLRPEVVADKARVDPTLAEYQDRRLRAPYTADAQFALGVWAEEHGLHEQAKAHLTAVIRLDPKRDAAWKKLGYRKHDGRWTTDAQLAAEKSEAEAQKAADRKWKPLLEKYRSMLERLSSREQAESALLEVTDPRAVPMIGVVFANTAAGQPRAVQLLGQIESAAASRGLAFLALFAKSAEARKVAAEILRQRDPREYLGVLIGFIRDPIKYEVKPVGGPGSPGAIFIQGKTRNVQRVYAPPSAPSIALGPNDLITYDADGYPVVVRSLGTSFRPDEISRTRFTPAEYSGQLAVTGDRARILQSTLASPGNSYANIIAGQTNELSRLSPAARLNFERMSVISVVDTRYIVDRAELDIPIGRMIAESQKTALAAEQQLENDVRSIERSNADTKAMNARVRSILKDTIGQDLGDDRVAWDRLWVDRQGYVFRMTATGSVSTVVENVPLDYSPAPIGPTVAISSYATRDTLTASSHHSCFAAGTSVRTIEGDRPIETIQAGDLVLVQDTRTGALGYQGVLTAFHNPPNATLKIRLGGSETVVATGIHRFWKAGKGWTMARDLKAGDQVRTLGGVATVEGVEDDRVQPVFNLEVGEGHSFLVGKLGALVHDNSLVEPTPEPFDGGPKSAK